MIVMKWLDRLLWGVKRLPEPEAQKVMRAAVLAERPHWDDMSEEVIEAVYWLTRCTVCDAPRYEHLREWKRHLAVYGGTG